MLVFPKNAEKNASIIEKGLVTTDYGIRTGGTLGLGRDIGVLLFPLSQAHDGA